MLRFPLKKVLLKWVTILFILFCSQI